MLFHLTKKLFVGAGINTRDYKERTPVFNVADIGVVIGCSLIIMYSIVSERREKDKKRAKSK